MDFEQETEQVRRDEEEMCSDVVVLERGEMKWLRLEAAKANDWYPENPRLFLKEKHCRRGITYHNKADRSVFGKWRCHTIDIGRFQFILF